jgi:hypothetical protein
MDNYEQLFTKLIDEIKLYNPNSNFDLIIKPIV